MPPVPAEWRGKVREFSALKRTRPYAGSVSPPSRARLPSDSWMTPAPTQSKGLVTPYGLRGERVARRLDSVDHAIRELIANGPDEAALTGTAEPGITRDAEGRWHVRA